MTTLKMAFHSRTGRRMVEVFDDYDRFVAAIYPTEDGSNGVHIVSQHFEGQPTHSEEGIVKMPGYVVKFKKPY
jgi:hypothetical protein